MEPYSGKKRMLKSTLKMKKNTGQLLIQTWMPTISKLKLTSLRRRFHGKMRRCPMKKLSMNSSMKLNMKI